MLGHRRLLFDEIGLDFVAAADPFLPYENLGRSVDSFNIKEGTDLFARAQDAVGYVVPSLFEHLLGAHTVGAGVVRKNHPIDNRLATVGHEAPQVLKGVWPQPHGTSEVPELIDRFGRHRDLRGLTERAFVRGGSWFDLPEKSSRCRVVPERSHDLIFLGGRSVEEKHMRRAVRIGAIALALSACDRLKRADPPPRMDAAKQRVEQVKRACASQLTYARLKEYVFDQAAQIRDYDPRRFDSLAAYSVVRMDDPVVKSRDDKLDIIVCTGRFVLSLPPGIQDAFNGQPVIAANVEYAAQAAADGSGLVYSMNGAEPIIYRIATLGLPGGRIPAIAPAPAAAPSTEIPATTVSPARVRPAPTPPTNEQTERTEPKIARAVEPKRPAAPSHGTTRLAKGAAAPSFNCGQAHTASERMVCGNGTLAAADRRMSALFYGEMAGADARTKSALRRTRDQFLRARERCSSDSCVARVYEERIAEIRSIAGR